LGAANVRIIPLQKWRKKSASPTRFSITIPTQNPKLKTLTLTDTATLT